VKDVRELKRDVTAAGDQDSLWQIVQMERLVRGDAELSSADRLIGSQFMRRPSSGGNQDRFGGNGLIGVQEAQRMRVLEHGIVGKDLHARLLDVARVDSFKAIDFLVLVRDQSLPIETPLADAPAEALCEVEIVGEMTRIDEQFLRDAAAYHAGAAHA
jgi:hypothetical protein